MAFTVGVMRFLQIEWHSHERARNAWDIERAEMKSKIAKQEGDCRSAKKLNDQLDRQIRMLEKALKNERAKSRAVSSGEKAPADDDARKESKTKASLQIDPHAGEGYSTSCYAEDLMLTWLLQHRESITTRSSKSSLKRTKYSKSRRMASATNQRCS